MIQFRPTPGSLASRRLEERPGDRPSSLAIRGAVASTQLSALILHEQGALQRPIHSLDDITKILADGTPAWIRVNGHGDRQLIADLFARCKISDLFLASTLETPQAPRLDCFADVVALVAHRLQFSGQTLKLTSDQVSIFLTRHLLLTVEEVPTPEGFAALTDWLLHEHPNAADEELDDLMHYMVDTLLDGIFPMLEQLIGHEA